MLARRLDLLEIAHAGLVGAIGRVLEQNFAVADDGVERRAQLVAHIGEERRLDPAGRFGGLLGLSQLDLRLHPIVDVDKAGDDRLLAAVVERNARDHDIGFSAVGTPEMKLFALA